MNQKSAYLDKWDFGDELHRSTGLSCLGFAYAVTGKSRAPKYQLLWKLIQPSFRNSLMPVVGKRRSLCSNVRRYLRARSVEP